MERRGERKEIFDVANTPSRSYQVAPGLEPESLRIE
jgi:hypothetical protein